MDVCVDIGATKTLVAVFDQDKIVPYKTQRFLTEPQKGFEDFLNRLLGTIENLLMGNQLHMWGICTAGAVDENGNVLWSPNLGWKNLALRNIMTEVLGTSGVVENDCNAAAYAEAWFRKSENLAYVTVSTGIGMGLVLNRKIFYGSHFSAGEIGHTIIEENGPVCSCGRRGCLQAISSGKGLENTIYSLIGQKINCEEILRMAEDRIEPYLKVTLHGAQVLGRFLTNVIDILDLEVLVLGGGLTKSEFYIDMVIKYIQQNYYKLPNKNVSVELAKGEPNPGIIGVLLLARQVFGGV